MSDNDIVVAGPIVGMIGKLVAFALVAAPLGILLGLAPAWPAELVGSILFMLGSAVLGVALVLALVLLAEGILFRRPDRWTRFN